MRIITVGHSLPLHDCVYQQWRLRRRMTNSSIGATGQGVLVFMKLFLLCRVTLMSGEELHMAGDSSLSTSLSMDRLPVNRSAKENH